MNVLLQEHLGKICMIYIDDGVSCGSNEEELARNIRLILDIFEAANIKINKQKSHLTPQEEVTFLGHIVGFHTIRPNPKNTRVIKDLQLPNNTKAPRRFMGFANYFRRFIPKFSLIAKPLSGRVNNITPESDVLNIAPLRIFIVDTDASIKSSLPKLADKRAKRLRH